MNCVIKMKTEQSYRPIIGFIGIFLVLLGTLYIPIDSVAELFGFICIVAGILAIKIEEREQKKGDEQ